MADRLAAGRHGGAPIQTHESNSNGPLLSLSLELFAVVLLHLPMRDLLLAQRVCKCFANVINGWPAIQQALYFRPAPTRTSSNDSVAPVINPLLRQQVTITSAPIVYTSSGGLRRPILVSVDFTNSSHNTTQLEDVPGSEAMSVTRPSIHLDDFTSTAQPAIFGVSETTQCHAQGSWRRMLATQPPCELDFTCTTDIQSSILAPLLERLSTGLVTLGNIWATECYAEVGRRSGQQLVQAVWAEEAQGGRLDNSIAQLSAWWWWDAGWIDGLLDIGTDGVGGLFG